ncbi:hypothetical protein ASG73_06030 [Janibacter sp. Soil728]|uniref:hypothetical protein n=1 Tax=Janibacter sp. Soil728 TaxID=1736393 RepID=UPI0006F541E1|nr:hypothetical protein [Janibacter sp. Soil728]KRE38486.1 hypothetical protein ASG73_06030 [Janibacter sp. Soil728]
MTDLWRDPLNDLSRPMAIVLAALMAPVGAFVGVVVAITIGDREPSGAAFVVPVLAMGVLVGVVAWYVVTLMRHDARLTRALADGNAEVVSGRVQGRTVPGRVVQSLPDRSGSVVGAVGHPHSGTGRRVLATVLAPAGPRRVAALVPDHVPVRRGTALPLVLHPTRRDVAVLDTRVPPAEVAVGDADPRWSGRLPTHSSVTGGWAFKLATALASLAVFAVLSAVVTIFTGAEDRYASAPTTATTVDVAQAASHHAPTR